MNLAVFAFLLFVCLASGQVEVLILDVYGDDDQFNAFAAATAFDDVNVSEGILGFGYENAGAFDSYNLVVYISDQSFSDDETQVANLLSFALAGGSVLVTGDTKFDGNDHLIELVGGLVADGYDTCSIYDYANYSDDPDAYSFASNSECAPLLSGGFLDIAETFPSYDSYYNVFQESRSSECVTTLDTTLEDPAASCLGDGTFFTARPVGENGGAIYYLSSDYSYAAVQAGFYFVMYNNLLAHLGATPPDTSSFPETNVLVIGDYLGEDFDYYSSAFRTGGIPTANVDVGFWETLQSLDYGQYDMIILTSYESEYSPRNENSYKYLQQYAAFGGVVLLTGQDAYDDYTYYLLGAESIFDCSDFGDEGPFDLDAFPADEPLCAPLLNGGYRDMTGQDPDELFPYSFTLDPNDDLDCPHLSGLLGTPCLISTEYNDYVSEDLALWVIRHYGDKGGLIAVMPVDNDWGPYSFNLGFYRVALMNLMVYAGNQGTCSAESLCLTSFGPDSSTSWGLYAPACISWNAIDFPQGETVTLSLVSDTSSKVIASDIDINDQVYEWPLVFGMSPSTRVHIEFSFSVSPSMVSDDFMLLNPMNSVPNPCISPRQDVCGGRDRPCDEFPCCDGFECVDDECIEICNEVTTTEFFCQSECPESVIMTAESDTFGCLGYDSNADVSWLITTPTSGINLTFTRLNMECCCDDLNVYAGTDASAPLLGNFDCDTLPPAIDVDGDSVFITFTSDSSVQGNTNLETSGFQISYTSAE